jgi:hypothetical protein
MTRDEQFSDPTAPDPAPGGGPRRPTAGIGIGAFWCVVVAVAAISWSAGYLPAVDRIDRHQAAISDAQTRLMQARTRQLELQSRRDALDDPHRIEKLLRERHNWIAAARPTGR